MTATDFQASLGRINRARSRALAVKELAALARLDVGREIRKGIPEVVLAEGKEPRDVVRIALAMVARALTSACWRGSSGHSLRGDGGVNQEA